MQIVIPMAWEWSRFKKEWYKDPKPLINVDWKPMILRCLDFLPKWNKYIFICRKEHLEKYWIDKIIKEVYPNSQFISIDYLTEWQASTCLLSEKYIDMNNELLIWACDNGMIYRNFDKYKKLYDCLIWTFRWNSTVKRNPQMYWWVEIDQENQAKNISVKVPISNDPINDHAVVWTFYFKKAKDFFDWANKMISKNIRTNWEFYVDAVPNELILDWKQIWVFEISKYICWWTPNDLKTYNYWKNFFDKSIFHNFTTNTKLWQ